MLSGSDTLAHYQQVLDSVTFVTASENPNNYGAAPSRTVTWTLDDGSASNATSRDHDHRHHGGERPADRERRGQRGLHRAGGGDDAVGRPGGADPDSLTLAGATVKIAGGTFAGDGDVLGVQHGRHRITASYNSSTETLVLSGSTRSRIIRACSTRSRSSIQRQPDQLRLERHAGAHLGGHRRQRVEQREHVASTTSSVTAVNDAPTLAGVLDCAVQQSARR